MSEIISKMFLETFCKPEDAFERIFSHQGIHKMQWNVLICDVSFLRRLHRVVICRLCSSDICNFAMTILSIIMKNAMNAFFRKYVKLCEYIHNCIPPLFLSHIKASTR